METKICVYDNPATMAREAWRNGEVLMHIQANVLLGKEEFRGGDWFPFQLNVGPWESGRVVGNRAALSAKPGAEVMQTYIYTDDGMLPFDDGDYMRSEDVQALATEIEPLLKIMFNRAVNETMNSMQNFNSVSPERVALVLNTVRAIVGSAEGGK